ncbi:MAG: glutamine-hydrolyzing carbamoyl-phosphate synthase small subunit [Candidatus Schekmanbacteria bacterium]|nr:glutamine-hydrolyzing carbamoyl-phosphate synthase small subunit [Candidatus Schekmanbacteria bacterium]
MTECAEREALLVLEDGLVLPGRCFGAVGTVFGEVVFNTAMCGYQEVLTDPSYCGQIVVMTCPHIGNTGINGDDDESGRAYLSGFVVHNCCSTPSSWRARESLASFLEKQGVIGLEGIDTRRLTAHLRQAGALRGVLSTENADPHALLAAVRDSPQMAGRNLVAEVSRREIVQFTAGDDPGRDLASTLWPLRGLTSSPSPGHAPRRIVVYDFGVKAHTLRMLVRHGCQPTIVPAHTSAREVLTLQPDGILLANGPGDPATLGGAIEQIRELLGRCPIFGICLGHQLLARALEGRTYKLKFGHHGVNHPVKDLTTGHVEITSQNHGFAVDPLSFPAGSGVDLTHVSLYDGTCEGISAPRAAAFSVQYHPEAAPGPRDSSYLFRRFLEAIETTTARAAASHGA